MKIHFFRVARPNYNWFRLIHYLSIKSFAYHHPNDEIILHLDEVPSGSNWFSILMSEFSNIKLRNLDKDRVDEFDCIPHFIDSVAAQTLYDEGGLIVDMDTICLQSLTDIFVEGKLNVQAELDFYGKHLSGLGIGFMYGEAENSEIFKYIQERLTTYKKGEEYTKYSVDLMKDIYERNPERFHLIPQKLVDPIGPQYTELQNLFLHNREIPAISRCIHVSESVSWDQYLKHLTVEHIMTVETTFTKLVRQYIPQGTYNSVTGQDLIGLY